MGLEISSAFGSLCNAVLIAPFIFLGIYVIVAIVNAYMKDKDDKTDGT